jgi:hypothetical protein
VKALTVCEPMASALIFGGKDVENRQRLIGLRGVVIIQAGKSLSWYQPDICDWTHRRWKDCPANHVGAMHKFQRRHGMAIGLCYFGDPFKIRVDGPKGLPVVQPHSRWATGPVCYPVLGEIEIEPFPLCGSRGVFTVPAADIPAAVLEAAEQLEERVGALAGGAR